MSGKIMSVINSIHCLHKAFLCPGNNYGNHIGEEVFNNFDGKIKINSDPIVHRPTAKMHFPLEFLLIFW
jgi:hypothetical protein